MRSGSDPSRARLPQGKTMEHYLAATYCSIPDGGATTQTIGDATDACYNTAYARLMKLSKAGLVRKGGRGWWARTGTNPVETPKPPAPVRRDSAELSDCVFQPELVRFTYGVDAAQLARVVRL